MIIRFQSNIRYANLKKWNGICFYKKSWENDYALSHKWGEGAEIDAGMLLRKNRNVLACRNNNNLSGFYSKRAFFIRQLHFNARATSTYIS